MLLESELSHRSWGRSKVKVKVKIIQSCPTLCDPVHYTAHWIFQARILESEAFLFSRGSSQPRDWTQISHIAGGFFIIWTTREALKYDIKFKILYFKILDILNITWYPYTFVHGHYLNIIFLATNNFYHLIVFLPWVAAPLSLSYKVNFILLFLSPLLMGTACPGNGH